MAYCDGCAMTIDLKARLAVAERAKEVMAEVLGETSDRLSDAQARAERLAGELDAVLKTVHGLPAGLGGYNWPAIATSVRRALSPEARPPEERLRPVIQREDGCYAACLATILGVPLDEVPHPSAWELMQNHWHEYANRVHQWLQQRGYFRVWIPKFWEPAGLSVVHGTSPRAIGHCVVACDGRMVHDPYPSGGGLTEIEGYEVLIPRAELALSPEAPLDRAAGGGGEPGGGG
jgi:hypothetical protein